MLPRFMFPLRFPVIACFFSLVLFFGAMAGAAGSVESEIDEILSRSSVSENTWSILIETEGGEEIYSRNSSTPRRPASVTKLFPTSAAFDLLGPGHIWNGERIDVASRTINRNSHNTMADDLFRYLGATLGNGYSYSEGSRIVENWVASIGIDTTGLSLNDGSGLSWSNRISPVQAIGVLRYSLDNYSTYTATLSRACHYGTLSGRFCGTEGAGNIYGKTGTLPNGQTVSLTGFLDYEDQRYFFSFFANNATNVSGTRQAIDDAVLVLTDTASSTFAGGDWIETTASSLNLRTGPGTDFNVVESFPEGTVTRVHPHEQNGSRANGHNWWFVSLYPDGPEGWFAEAFLEATNSPEDWPWADVIVDNSDAGFTASGAWNVATWADDRHGVDYHHRDTEPVDDLAEWNANLSATGSYDVYAWWPAWSNRATAAPYLISHEGGTSIVRVDQTERGGQWNHLGRFHFSHDSEKQIALSPNTPSGEIVMADAVKFVPVDVAAPERFVLSISTEGAGQVERTPEASDYDEGENVELLALPDDGYSFVGWSGDVESDENPLIITMEGSSSLTAHFSRTFGAWVMSQFTEAEQQNESISASQATPAGDGVPNLVKYALGLDPHKPVAAALPAPAINALPEAGDDGFLTLTFSHPSDLTDIEYRVELSDDLIDWSTPAVLVSEEESEGVTTRTYRDTDPQDASERTFMRLRVTRE